MHSKLQLLKKESSQSWSLLTLSSLTLFIVSLCFGLWVRCTNLFHHGFYFDTIETQYTWGKTVSERGIVDAWLNFNRYIDYPPINWIYLGFLIQVGTLFAKGSAGFLIALKGWYVIADLLLLVLVWIFLKRYSVPTWKKFLTLGVLFSYPGFWFVSGVWGQSDTFHTLIVFSSIYLLYSKKLWQWLLGGILFGVAFWFKLQVILVLAVILFGVLAVYKGEVWMRWKKLVLVSPIVLIPGGLGLWYIGTVYKSHPGLYQGYSSYPEYLNTLTILASFGLLLIPLYFCIAFFQQALIRDHLQKFHVFLASFFGFSTFLSAVFLGLNPLQWFRNVWEPLGFGQSTFTGATNFFNVGTVIKSQLYDGLNLEFLKYFTLTIFGVVLVGWCFKHWNSMKDTLLSLLTAIGTFIIVYYAFSNGRVHSRYAHMGLILLLSVAPLLKLKFYQWIGLVGICTIYLVNQVGVYASFGINIKSPFLLEIAPLFPFSSYIGSSVLMLVSVLVFLSGFLSYPTFQESKNWVKGVLDSSKRGQQTKT